MANTYCVLNVVGSDRQVEALYTLNDTCYGRLLLIFTSPESGELERFRAYAQETLKAGYQIETTAVVADNLDEVKATLQKYLPGGKARVAVEETSFFDEVIAQLIADTLWKE